MQWLCLEVLLVTEIASAKKYVNVNVYRSPPILAASGVSLRRLREPIKR